MTRQLDVDEVLRSWLAESAERAPERQVSAALKEIERTPQRRGAIMPRLALPGLQPLLYAAIGILVVMIGIGVGSRTGVIRLAPSPVPIPSPSDAIEPDAGTRTFRALDLSFEIRLPTDWTMSYIRPDPSAMYLAADDPAVEVSIRAGDEDGNVLTCDAGAGPWETCETFAHADGGTLDELAAAIGLTPTAEEGIAPLGPTRTSTTLDGEPARVIKIEAYEHPAAGQEFVTYVVAIHDDRPFILRAWTPSAGGIDILDLIEGFSFLEPQPTPIPTPSPRPARTPRPDELQTFEAPDGTFEISLLVGWDLATGPDATALYLRNGSIRISIRAADADGTVTTCDEPGGGFERCDTVSPSTLEELVDAIGLLPEADNWLGPIEEVAILGGEPAWSIRVIGKTPNPLAVRYVVAMHDGRSFVIRATQPSPTDGLLELPRLLERFRFVDD